jgi:hypothetical protein
VANSGNQHFNDSPANTHNNVESDLHHQKMNSKSLRSDTSSGVLQVSLLVVRRQEYDCLGWIDLTAISSQSLFLSQGPVYLVQSGLHDMYLRRAFVLKLSFLVAFYACFFTYTSSVYMLGDLWILAFYLTLRLYLG